VRAQDGATGRRVVDASAERATGVRARASESGSDTARADHQLRALADGLSHDAINSLCRDQQLGAGPTSVYPPTNSSARRDRKRIGHDAADQRLRAPAEHGLRRRPPAPCRVSDATGASTPRCPIPQIHRHARLLTALMAKRCDIERHSADRQTVAWTLTRTASARASLGPKVDDGLDRTTRADHQLRALADGSVARRDQQSVSRPPNCQHAVRHSEPRVYRAGREAEARG
jgi:hypothetical protein